MADETPRPVGLRRLVPLGILVLGGALFMAAGGRRYLSFAALAENREWLCAMAARDEVTSALVFILGYAGLVALSFPAAELLTISGGFLFGRWLGSAYAVIGATAGATIMFLAARAGLADLTARAGPWVRRFETGFHKDALSYLLVLRLIPLFPFWLVNIVAGAIGLRPGVYVLGTFIGIIPGTFVYASLGSALGTLVATGQRPGLAVLFHAEVLLPILGLAALALLPVIYKRWRDRNGREPA
jgi:uncharacterized membrane protein YdjX (TVP38/TMEM64 family)